MTDMMQLQLFLSLTFETKGKGVHFNLKKGFFKGKLVLTDKALKMHFFFFFFFKIRHGAKLAKYLRTHILEMVGARKLKFSGFSYFNDKIKW